MNYDDIPPDNELLNQLLQGHNNEKVITVTMGDQMKQVCIDGDSASIRQLLRSCFGIKSTKGSMHLEKDGISYAIDRSLPHGTYTLHRQQQGVTVQIVTTTPVFQIEEKSFMNQEHLRLYLKSCNFKCLQESGKPAYLDHIDELVDGSSYLGIA